MELEIKDITIDIDLIQYPNLRKVLWQFTRGMEREEIYQGQEEKWRNNGTNKIQYVMSGQKVKVSNLGYWGTYIFQVGLRWHTNKKFIFEYKSNQRHDQSFQDLLTDLSWSSFGMLQSFTRTSKGLSVTLNAVVMPMIAKKNCVKTVNGWGSYQIAEKMIDSYENYPFEKNELQKTYVQNIRIDTRSGVTSTKFFLGPEPPKRTPSINERVTVIEYVGGCWDNGCMVCEKDKGWVLTEEISPGDLVLTGTDSYVEVKSVDIVMCEVERLIDMDGIMLTPGHPVLMNGEWVRPDKTGFGHAESEDEVMPVFNFVLEDEHSVVLKKGEQKLVVATVGRFATPNFV